MIDELCQSVILSNENSSWKDSVKSCIEDINNIEQLTPLSEVNDLSLEYNLDLYSAALLYHSQKEA